MPSRSWGVTAPSNIAWIKYMGKRPGNLPTNPSLSMTLDALQTRFKVSEASGDPGVSWPGAPDPASEARMRRFIERIEAGPCRAALEVCGLKRRPEKPRRLEIQSENSFPSGAGIASSASAFAAATLATAASCSEDVEAFFSVWAAPDSPLRRELSKVARTGSGSACRSLDGPWTLWREEGALPLADVHSAFLGVAHFVLVFSADRKAVGSSEAHQRILGSPLNFGRAGRAEHRLARVVDALRAGDWRTFSDVVWAEMWDMHSLFHTSDPPFSYWLPDSVRALQWIDPLRSRLPVAVTMDAGPNLHVLVPAADAGEWRARFAQEFPAARIFEDRPGNGAARA